jgi:hypothetical protein
MVRNGDDEKPIWISEMAWNAVPDEIPPNFGRVTEEQQARYAVEAYQRAQAEWPWIGVNNYWFFKRAADWEKDQAWYYFRMLEPDFTPMPVYEAVSDFANKAIAAEPQAEWHYVWMRLRPILFMFGAVVLFYIALTSLAPPKSE